ncbi:hypothetical protein B0A55_09001 [Friedmanniomyces simplex]|uniref:Uncharacterized protein n=1 Tax=Friedmanniomyces simplex TaxID=329884 RepID=A0A4U0X4J8_9PEZI|nr:hypothetical protein B0A55_09001 [Friedmanniomyces simplex]
MSRWSTRLWIAVLVLDFGILGIELVRALSTRILRVELFNAIRARILGADHILISLLEFVVSSLTVLSIERQLVKLQLGDPSAPLLLPGIVVKRKLIKLEFSSCPSTILLPGIVIDVSHQLFHFSASLHSVKLRILELFISGIANLELHQCLYFKQRDRPWILTADLLLLRAAVDWSEQLAHHLPNELPVPDRLLGKLEPSVASAVQQLLKPKRPSLQHDRVPLLASLQPGDNVDRVLLYKHNLLDYGGDNHFLRRQQQQLAREPASLQLAAAIQRHQHHERSGVPDFIPGAAYYGHRYDNDLHNDVPGDIHLHFWIHYAY